MQLALLVGRIVHSGHAAAELKAQVGVVSEVTDQLLQVLPRDVEGDLTAMDDDLGDHVAVVRNEGSDPLVDLIPPATKRRGGRGRKLHNAGEAAVSGSVAAALGSEHALTDSQHFGSRLGGGELS